MDLFPHDKLTTYLANRPNFPPSPQVLSLKEESSEVKRLLKLGRVGGGFARCSEGGKEISRTISNRVPYAISRRLGHLLPDFFANCTPVGHSTQPLSLQSNSAYKKCCNTLHTAAACFSPRLLGPTSRKLCLRDRSHQPRHSTHTVGLDASNFWFSGLGAISETRSTRPPTAHFPRDTYPRRIRDSRPASPVRENNTFSVSRTSPRKVGTHPSP